MLPEFLVQLGAVFLVASALATGAQRTGWAPVRLGVLARFVTEVARLVTEVSVAILAFNELTFVSAANGDRLIATWIALGFGAAVEIAALGRVAACLGNADWPAALTFAAAVALCGLVVAELLQGGAGLSWAARATGIAAPALSAKTFGHALHLASELAVALISCAAQGLTALLMVKRVRNGDRQWERLALVNAFAVPAALAWVGSYSPYETAATFRLLGALVLIAALGAALAFHARRQTAPDPAHPIPGPQGDRPGPAAG